MTTKGRVQFAVPSWLKQRVVIAYFSPEHLLFVPQRRVVWRDEVHCLLDGRDRAYSLANCESARHGHLTGSLLLISEHGHSLRLIAKNGFYRLTDGDRDVWLDLPLHSTDYAAAQSLAQFFSGSVYTEVRQ